jgi:hypothetical protein
MWPSLRQEKAGMGLGLIYAERWVIRLNVF